MKNRISLLLILLAISFSIHAQKVMRIGIIGLDTSHSTAFTELINSGSDETFSKGFRVVAAYPYGSKTIQSSYERIPGYIEKVKANGVEITLSIADLLEKVDCVLLETNDGRLHLEQAVEVFKSGKICYIDKPVGATLGDAIAIYEMAEKYLNYFSDYDPMKKLRLGQLYMEQEKTEEAYEKLENIILSEYTTLNLAFGMMITKALDNKDHKSARFLAEKMYALAGIFEMGKYNECATMFNVVVAEQNVEDTFKVIKQLLENVDTICDFQKSRLYKHIKFQDVENPYAEEMKKELIAGFQNEEDFAYMKGYKPWKKLLAKY